MQAQTSETKIRRAAFIGFMVEPCCCDVCCKIGYCRDTGKSCKAFRHFVRRGKFEDRHIGVELK